MLVFPTHWGRRPHVLELVAIDCSRASALQSVDLAFISLVQLYHKTLKNSIHSHCSL